MVNRGDRPIVPTEHTDEREHRRLLATRTNASFPKDGTEGMTAPSRQMSYATVDLPDATLWEGSTTFDSTLGQLVYSDGVSWIPVTPSTTGRELLTADRTYYLRADGSDANTGLVNNSGGAFLTWAHAINVATESIDCQGYAVTIQVGSGTDWGTITVGQPLLDSDTPLILKSITGNSILVLTDFASVRLDTVSLDAALVDEATGLFMQDHAYCEIVSGTLIFGEGLSFDFDLRNYAFFNADGDYETHMNSTSDKAYHGSVSGHSRYQHDSGTGIFWNTDNPKPPDPGQGTFVFQEAVFAVADHALISVNGPASYTGSVDDVTASELLMAVECDGPWASLTGNTSSITEGQANIEHPAGFWPLIGNKGSAYVDDDDADLGRHYFVDGIVVSDSRMDNYDEDDPTVGGYYGGYMGKGTTNTKNGTFEQGYRLGNLLVANGTTVGVNFADFIALYGSWVRRLRVEFSLIAGTDGTQLQFRSSADGTTFDSGGTDYSYQKDEIDNGASVIAGSNGASSMIATTATIGNAGTERITGWIEVSDPSDTSRWPQFAWEVTWIDNSATPRLRVARGAGSRRTAAVIKGLQFSAASGSITSVAWSVHHTQAERIN